MFTKLLNICYYASIILSAAGQLPAQQDVYAKANSPGFLYPKPVLSYNPLSSVTGNTRQNKIQSREPPSLPHISEVGVEVDEQDETDILGQKVVEANNNFAFNLYNSLLQSNGNGNFVFSPLSLSTLLGMLQAGANRETLEEIHSALTLDQPSSNVNIGFQKLLSNLKRSISNSNVTLQTSNRVFIQEGLPLEIEFQSQLKEKYNSPAVSTDFRLPNAAQKINKLVAADTQQEIRDLIEPGVLTNSTRMVALSTLYFKGAWFNPFHGRATKKREFFKNGSEKTLVDMMNTEDYFRVADIGFLNAKAIALPYADKGQEMIIILPNELNGLPAVESILNTRRNAYKQIIENLNQHPKNVVLFLPKFSLQSTLDLKKTLLQMGIRNAFDEFAADFTKIAGSSEQLFLSKILQKAFLKVAEAGSEAGAASFGAVFTPLSIGPAIEDTIQVNRPFMGFIRDVQNDLILFTFRKVE